MSDYPDHLMGLHWFTAQASNGSGACVEVAFLTEGRVAVRDSKDRGVWPLVVGGQGWICFVQGAGAGTFGPVD
ncbi:DUF397 domain-containing protein [Streptomyces longispororuber]|uniref:DUF397 domain-containing protein n=1 Tax=Streptomyces longispororuber TaxID=68230 RepID=UPI00210BB4F8|nr:DUF397 domain-containing protein [Streptomyces longispororuber]MCQ4212577.1 DUF397 domain-containing protein [Streptomyces longispororuber]